MITEKQKDSNVVIVDARTPQEHIQARIPGSILNNWENGLGDYGKMIKDKEILKNEFSEKGITPDKEIICYCHSGMRASHTYLQFKHAGFPNVRLYDGSMIDWMQQRKSIE
jgi:thiosulfate/3-mercaptopyruvate sulfurtransferase